MSRLSPQHRRETLISATIQVVQQHGFAGATVRDIAQALGISSGLIHHYFDSFDGLLSAAFDKAASDDLEWLQKIVDQNQPPLQQLQSLICNYTNPDTDWLFQLWFDAWSEAVRRPELQKTSRRLNLAWQKQIAKVIRKGVKAKVFRCSDAHSTAWRLLSLLDGLAIQVFAHQRLVTREQMILWTLQAAELELGLTPGSLSSTALVSSKNC